MAHQPHRKPLKVSKPDGERIYAFIYPNGEGRIIEVGYLAVVAKDKPPFARQGVIRFNVPNANYAQGIEKVEKYLETLLLKEMNDGDNNSSVAEPVDGDGDKGTGAGGDNASDSGQGDTASVHDSPRGNKPAKDTRRRPTDSKVATSSDTSTGSKGSKGH